MREAVVSSEHDSGLHFELTLLLPHDVRFATTIRDLAVHAARHVGCAGARAEAFGRVAEELLRSYLDDAVSRRDVPVVVRRVAGPLEVLVDERMVTLDV